ncbi:MAG: hypothetical protein HQL63_06230 [Magnetococcales bacterium]|nr:hypothetical protein [Magnetococcales bacterium]MBF0321629.1 hypothetical protein [Magnetococcales bacterium]
MEEQNRENHKLRLINRVRKEMLVRTAESLIHSQDWRTTGKTLRRIMNQLRGIPSTGDEEDERLWARFQSAYQIYLDRRARDFDHGQQLKLAQVRDEILERQQKTVQLELSIHTARGQLQSFVERLHDIPPGPRQEVIRHFIADTIKLVKTDVTLKEQELRDMERALAELSDRVHGC